MSDMTKEGLENLGFKEGKRGHMVNKPISVILPKDNEPMVFIYEGGHDIVRLEKITTLKQVEYLHLLVNGKLNI